MRLLVVEDDHRIANYLSQGLTDAGFQVDKAHDGEEGFKRALTGQYDLLVLDLMLPRMDGLAVLNRLRTSGVTSKILILSANQSVSDRIRGLQDGGDDFLTKPFSFGELVARCQVLLRRTKGLEDSVKLVQGDVSLDLLSREVYRGGQKIDLPAKEFLLLEYFLRNPGVVLSKSQILERVWAYAFDTQTNVVDVLVCRLRNKIDHAQFAKTIHTIRGVGYVFKPA